jgi:hypothetical protein
MRVPERPAAQTTKKTFCAECDALNPNLIFKEVCLRYRKDYRTVVSSGC